MMARKLSIVARHGSLILLAVAGTASAQDTRPQGDARVTKPGAILPNPFAPGAQRPESVAVEPGAPPRGPVTYHNPFPSMSTAPSRSPARTREPAARSARGWKMPTAGDVVTVRESVRAVVGSATWWAVRPTCEARSAWRSA